MVQIVAGRMRGAASAIREAVLQAHAARLAIMAARLRKGLPLPAILLAGILIFCGWLALSSGRSVFAVLSPAWPIAAGIVATIAGLAVLELCAAFAITLLTAALQLAYDTGRHRVRALLVIASGLALAGLGWRLAELEPAALHAALLPIVGSFGLLALTIWFERAYLRPAYPGFRDFWVDVVAARHFLTRAAHGE
ncbi:hypothetical protein [Bosea sp. BH3]|uniref:hypothetical protein n=1 Tax=Bosea sp. BH3 TaxID=2871701 RepID=UPI0021CB9042|nr:hypothetical protein [Bosea sp. BH3]MCU4182147.1 hypothetical protein [Bosea sp. BH3]